MKKQAYQQPATTVVRVAIERMISQSTGNVNSITGNVFDNTTITGSNQAARVKEVLNGWDDAWQNP